MRVNIIETLSGRIIATYHFGESYGTTSDYITDRYHDKASKPDDAWRNAVEDNIVNDFDKDKYTFEVIE